MAPSAGPKNRAENGGPRHIRRRATIRKIKSGELADVYVKRRSACESAVRCETTVERRGEAAGLAAQSEVGDQLAVAIEVFLREVTQQPAPLADLHQQAAPAVMILFVDFEMLVELVDRRGENGDLHVG